MRAVLSTHARSRLRKAKGSCSTSARSTARLSRRRTVESVASSRSSASVTHLQGVVVVMWCAWRGEEGKGGVHKVKGRQEKEGVEGIMARRTPRYMVGRAINSSLAVTSSQVGHGQGCTRASGGLPH